MMMFMPIMFTFMFLWAPAGVALYWLMSNVWGIGQQYADELHDRSAERPDGRGRRPSAG